MYRWIYFTLSWQLCSAYPAPGTTMGSVVIVLWGVYIGCCDAGLVVTRRAVRMERGWADLSLSSLGERGFSVSSWRSHSKQPRMTKGPISDVQMLKWSQDKNKNLSVMKCSISICENIIHKWQPCTSLTDGTQHTTNDRCSLKIAAHSYDDVLGWVII